MVTTDRYISLDRYAVIRRFTGLGVLIAALCTYFLTMEPTASYWDCPEYIAVATGMQPGHPPGNPVWMLAARFFINFAPDAASRSLMVNALSAVCAALAVWVLFLTIEWFARRLVMPDSTGGRVLLYKALRTLGAAVTGALALCWSDSFWFSAVEAEVYAFSSLCTALIFWLSLLWYDRRRQPRSDRWLILIIYLTGLSVGVHELNLLCLPAVAMVVLYGTYGRPGFWRLCGWMVGSMGCIAFALYGVIPGFMAIAMRMELLFVNDLSLPFNSGLIAAWIVVMSLLVAGALWLGSSRFARRPGVRQPRLVLWSLAFFLLGFSSYAVIIIRAGANPPVNTGHPSDIFSFASYFSREQYGKTPLVYGHSFGAEPQRERNWVKDADGRSVPVYNRYRLINPRPVYARGCKGMSAKPGSVFATAADSARNAALLRRGGDSYILTDYSFRLGYPHELDMWFPRMHSHAPDDVSGYFNWLGTDAESMYYPDTLTLAVDSAGHPVDLPGNVTVNRSQFRPTYLQNLQYFAVYQCGFMYWRYFFWNFVGRQNDISGHGEPDAGNFVTGIEQLDHAMLDNSSGAPVSSGDTNKGHNVYYAMPLLLGILGIIWQMHRGVRGRRQALVILTLFVLTGIAIVFYLNQTPVQARDRDYAFAGSWYAFAIWIGLGLPALCGMAAKLLRRNMAGTCLGILLALCVPLQMLSQTADDHDRSHRTVTPDMMYNMFAAMEPGAIFIASDDNTIFPAWYMQEVEEERTDIRCISAPYIGSSWYQLQLLDHMRESAPVPVTAPRELIASGRMSFVSLSDSDLNWTPALDALRRLYAGAGRTRGASAYPCLATPRLYFVMEGDTVFIDMRRADGPGMSRLISGSSLFLVDMLATSAASRDKRPVYWPSATARSVLGGQLKPYLEQIGTIARLNPASPGFNASRTAALALTQYRYGGASHRPYCDPVAAHQLSMLRRNILLSAYQLADRGDSLQVGTAVRLIELCLREIPAETAPYEAFIADSDGKYTDECVIAAQTYLAAGKKMGRGDWTERGREMLKQRREYLRKLEAFRLSLRPAYRRYITTRAEMMVRVVPQLDSLLLRYTR